MTVTEEIKSRLDIVDIISETVNLRKAGRSYSGFCPFHPNSRTPAFHVFPETQTWRCFGACAEGGDLISFVMKKQGWDFKEALAHLAARAGIQLEENRPVNKEKEAREKRLTDLLTAAAAYFHQLLLHAPQAETARRYVTDRALTEETLAYFQVGFALDSWDQCRTHFNAQGYTDQELLDVGLLSENPEKGTRYDRFRNRLMIPIRSGQGQIVGFGARTLDPEGLPKYLNSPQSVLFDKSSVLFGLDGAKRSIREARQAVIVEGYMDVMMAWQAGFHNVVAQMGTALTQVQLQLLKRYTKRFVLALDADAAGAKATLRSLQVARETLDRELDIRFDAHNLVRYEGRLEADIRIVTLPAGKDPDNIIREDPTQWPLLLAQAKPVVAYVIGVLTQDLDLNDAKAKTAVAQQIIPLIEDITNPVERDQYWQQLAYVLHTTEKALRQLRQTPQKRSPRQSYSVPEPPPPEVEGVPALHRSTPSLDPNRSVQMREANLLSQCLHHPKALNDVNVRLTAVEQPPVTRSDFTAAEDRELFEELTRWLSRGLFVSIDELCDSLEGSLLERASQLRASLPTSDSDLDRLADKLVLSVLDMRHEKTRRLNTRMQQLVAEAKEVKDTASIETYQMQSVNFSQQLRRIQQAKNAMSSVSKRQNEEAALNRF
ncbi:MAG: DNA primase [Chloroflexota bacterium]